MMVHVDVIHNKRICLRYILQELNAELESRYMHFQAAWYGYYYQSNNHTIKCLKKYIIMLSIIPLMIQFLGDE